MSTDYPGGLDAFTNPVSTDPVTSPSHADQHTNANDAIEAVQGELGTDPAGTHSTVVDRLDDMEFTPVIRAERATSTQSINNNTLTDVIFNSVAREDDEAGDFTLNTGTGVLTINRTGWYDIAAGIVWASGTGERLVRILVNGSTQIAQDRRDGASLAIVQTLSTKIRLTATDTLRVNVRQQSGGALTISNDSSTFMAVNRIR